jgi:hypothetical protein
LPPLIALHPRVAFGGSHMPLGAVQRRARGPRSGGHLVLGGRAFSGGRPPFGGGFSAADKTSPVLRAFSTSFLLEAKVRRPSFVRDTPART